MEICPKLSKTKICVRKLRAVYEFPKPSGLQLSCFEKKLTDQFSFDLKTFYILCS